MDTSSTPTPELLLRHGRSLRALARRLLGDPHLAEDVAQETLTRWIEREPGFARRPGSWLRTVARNLSRRAVRGRRHREAREERVARPEAVPSVAEEAEQAEALGRVVEAVLALEEPYRSTILARYFRGTSARRLAEETGAPLATVRSREQRALARLRERLDRICGERGAWSAALAPLAGAKIPGLLATLLATGKGAMLLAAALVLVAGAVLVWRGSSPTPTGPSADPIPVAGPEPSELPAADDPATADEPEEVESGERRLVPVASEGKLRIGGRVDNVAYPELGLEAGPAVAASVYVHMRDDRGGESIPGIFVTTDQSGRFHVEFDDPDVRPLQVTVGPDMDPHFRGVLKIESLAAGESSLEDLVFRRAAHGVLSGVTVDAEGNALGGIHVRFPSSGYEKANLREYRYRPELDRVTLEAVSGADGTFRIEGFVQFPYRHPKVRPEVMAAGFSYLGCTVPRKLETGGWSPVRFTLAREGDLRVIVRDLAGSPVEGVNVDVLLAAAEVSPGENPIRNRRRAKTDARGQAYLSDVWLGPKLWIRLETSYTYTYVYVHRHEGGRLMLGAGDEGRPIILPSLERPELEVTIPTILLRGRATFANGEGLGYWPIHVTDMGTEHREPGGRTFSVDVEIETEEDGSFTRRIVAEKLVGPIRVGLREVPTAPEESGSETVFLDPSLHDSADEIRLVKNRAEPDAEQEVPKGHTLAGRILDPRGEPLPSGRVTIVPAGTAPATATAVLRWGIPLEEGSFVATELASGLHDVHVAAEVAESPLDSPFHHCFAGVPVDSEAIELRLPPGKEARVHLRAWAGSLEGVQAYWSIERILPFEELSRRPAPRRIGASNLADWYSRPPAERDRFRAVLVEAPAEVLGEPDLVLAEGWYAFFVGPLYDNTVDFFPAATEPFYLEGGEYTIDLDLRPTTTLRGRLLGDTTREFLAVSLVDDAGHAIPIETRPTSGYSNTTLVSRAGRAVPVRIPGAGEWTTVIEVRASGEFEFARVPVGSFRLRAGSVAELRRGRFRFEMPIELFEGENAPVEIEL